MVIDAQCPGRAGARLDQLVDAATLVFSSVGYHVATVQEIAAAAGVSIGLIYRYVPDKHELLYRCLRHIVERHRSGIPVVPSATANPVDDLGDSVASYFQAVATRPGSVRLLCRESGSLRREHVDALQAMTLDTNARIASRIDACVCAGLMSTGNADLLAYRVLMVCHAWDLRHWAMTGAVSSDEYLADAVHACWTPRLTREGRHRWSLHLAAKPTA